MYIAVLNIEMMNKHNTNLQVTRHGLLMPTAREDLVDLVPAKVMGATLVAAIATLLTCVTHAATVLLAYEHLVVLIICMADPGICQ